ncbi:MAG: hypothetical protein AB7S87_15150, partial [Burkholderiales bacterium]
MAFREVRDVAFLRRDVRLVERAESLHVRLVQRLRDAVGDALQGLAQLRPERLHALVVLLEPGAQRAEAREFH